VFCSDEVQGARTPLSRVPGQSLGVETTQQLHTLAPTPSSSRVSRLDQTLLTRLTVAMPRAACAPAERFAWLHGAWLDPTVALKVAPLALLLLSVPMLFLSMLRGAPDPVYHWADPPKKTR
jgi:hypothetical protein